MPDVVLKVGGRDYTGWKSIRIQRSLTQVAARVDLGLSPPPAGKPHPFTPGSECTVLLGGRALVKGITGAPNIQHGPDRETYTVTAWDRTSLLMGDHDGEIVEWKEITILEAAREVCKPFGVRVSAADTGDPFPKVTYGQGDSVKDFLARYARQRGLLLVSDGQGGLVITRPGVERSPVALVLGKNILWARNAGGGVRRYSKYIVKGQSKPDGAALDLSFTKMKSGEDPEGEAWKQAQDAATAGVGVAEDPSVRYHCPKIVISGPGDPASYEAHARWLATTTAGKSRAAVIGVQGWEAVPGRCWEIGWTVSLADHKLAMDGDFLIESLVLSSGLPDGDVAELGLIHPDAYAAKPEPKQAGKIKNDLDLVGSV